MEAEAALPGRRCNEKETFDQSSVQGLQEPGNLRRRRVASRAQRKESPGLGGGESSGCPSTGPFTKEKKTLECLP